MKKSVLKLDLLLINILFMVTRIRTAKKNDVPLVLSLLYELDRPKPEKDSDLDFFRTLVQKQITDSDKTILVAEIDDVTVVGMISMVFLPRLNQLGPEIYVPELIVSRNYQNQGIGTLLLNTSISLAKKRNCHRIRLESGINRKGAHKFYKKFGFEAKSFSFSKNLN